MNQIYALRMKFHRLNEPLYASNGLSVVPATLKVDQIGYALDMPRVGLGKVISDYLVGHDLA
jgi:hypothetical protein